jgi:Flp pilus assembly protein TadG
MRGSPALYFAGRINSFGLWQAMIRLAAQWRACRSAAVAPLTALMLLPISGALAYAVELGSWQYMQRSMQNAADSAAIAAASVNSGTATTGTTSLLEARAAAATFGYVDGTGNTAVTAALEPSCPTGAAPGSTCYRATITTTFPLLYSRLIGFSGTDGSSQRILSSAVAITAGTTGGSTTPGQLLPSNCVWAQGSLQANGTPNANLTGCSVMSTGAMTCTGDNGLQADFAISGGTISGKCAANSPTNNLQSQTIPSDPYASLASSIPSTTCPKTNQTKGEVTGKLLVLCGNVNLSGDLTLKSSDTIVVIKNGTLDLNNHTLKTASGASATLIFDGSAPPFGDKNMKGTIDIQAPPSTSNSEWKGVAVYRKPGSAVDATLAGSKATWQITGLVYLPNTNVTLSGAVNHSSTGATCFVLVGQDITINGNGQILQTTAGCSDAGLTPPSYTTPGTTTPGTAYRVRLVQ